MFLQAPRQVFYEAFHEYNVHLDFVADKLGEEVIYSKAKEIYIGFSDEMKQQVEDYKNGAGNKA
ncbi:MAG: hypothetical protein ACI4HQ_14500 [Acetatifactor sp.]